MSFYHTYTLSLLRMILFQYQVQLFVVNHKATKENLHRFHEKLEECWILFIETCASLLNRINLLLKVYYISWRDWQQCDGRMFKDWFRVGMNSRKKLWWSLISSIYTKLWLKPNQQVWKLKLYYSAGIIIQLFNCQLFNQNGKLSGNSILFPVELVKNKLIFLLFRVLGNYKTIKTW